MVGELELVPFLLGQLLSDSPAFALDYLANHLSGIVPRIC